MHDPNPGLIFDLNNHKAINVISGKVVYYNFTPENIIDNYSHTLGYKVAFINSNTVFISGRTGDLTDDNLKN